jgi:hypothetical protein
VNAESSKMVFRGRVEGGFGVLGGGGGGSCWNPATKESMVEGSRNISVGRVGVSLGVNYNVRSTKRMKLYIFLTQNFPNAFLSNCP